MKHHAVLYPLDSEEAAKRLMEWRSTHDQAHHLRTGWRTKTGVEQIAWYKSIDTSKTAIYMFTDESINTTGYIGYVALENIDWHDRRAELSGLVEDPKSNSDSLKEAWKELIKLAFDNMGLVRIDSVCYANAPERIQLVQKMGFVEEGRKAKAHYWNGEWHDEILFGLVK